MKDFIFGASLVWFWYTPKTWTSIGIFTAILAVLLMSPTVKLQYRWHSMMEDEDENDR